MAWISPTGYNDPEEAWIGEGSAYDDNTSSFTSGSQAGLAIPPGQWGSFLELTIDAMYSENVRFFADMVPGRHDLIDVDVYKDGAWVHVYEGAYTEEWVEKTFTLGSVTKARLRIHIHPDYQYKSLCYLFEFDFGEAEAPPVQPYSYIM